MSPTVFTANADDALMPAIDSTSSYSIPEAREADQLEASRDATVTMRRADLDGSTCDVAMICAVPWPTAVTSPVALTVATAVFEEDQASPVPTPGSAVTRAVS